MFREILLSALDKSIPKRRYHTTQLHGVVLRKTAICIFTHSFTYL